MVVNYVLDLKTFPGMKSTEMSIFELVWVSRYRGRGSFSEHPAVVSVPDFEEDHFQVSRDSMGILVSKHNQQSNGQVISQIFRAVIKQMAEYLAAMD